MAETAIHTCIREVSIALKPRHQDLKHTLTVEETVVEVSIKNFPTGTRMLTKPYQGHRSPHDLRSSGKATQISWSSRRPTASSSVTVLFALSRRRRLGLRPTN
jgi:hypothetical protein